MGDGRDGGFFYIHRQFLSWPVLQNLRGEHGFVWLAMIAEACWKPTEVVVKEGRVLLHRGEFITGQEELARKARVGRKVVRTLYAHALRDGAITQRVIGTGIGRFRGRRVVATTIVNYSRYQGPLADRGHSGATEGPDPKKGKKGKNKLSPSDRIPSTPFSPPIDEGKQEQVVGITDLREWHRRRDDELTRKYGLWDAEGNRLPDDTRKAEREA